MSFTIFYNKKTRFQAIKKRSSKSRTIDIFPNELTHGFGQKLAIFFNFFFLDNIGQENVFYHLLERKNAFVGYKNKKFKKSKKFSFFESGQHLVLVKKRQFFPTFFKAIQPRKMSFTIFQNEKTLFYLQKTCILKRRKIASFPKGLTHGFGPKMAIFPTFYLRHYRPEICLLRYSRTEKRLSRH